MAHEVSIRNLYTVRIMSTPADKKVDLNSSSLNTRTIESPAGLIKVKDVSIREYRDAQQSGTLEKLIRDKMILSVAKSQDSPPVLADDLTVMEMEQAVQTVKDNREAKLKDSMALVKNLWGGTMAATVSPIVPNLLYGANLLRTNANERMRLGLTEAMRPSTTPPDNALLDLAAEKGKREWLALEAQIKTADMLEEIHTQLVVTESQNQRGHDLQKRIFAVVLATFALTAVGVIAAVVIQLSS